MFSLDFVKARLLYPWPEGVWSYIAIAGKWAGLILGADMYIPQLNYKLVGSFPQPVSRIPAKSLTQVED